MNLYLVKWKNYVYEYDTFDSFIIATKNSERAKLFHPEIKKFLTEEEFTHLHFPEHYSKIWPNSLDNIEVTYLGKYEKNEEELILASYNAG